MSSYHSKSTSMLVSLQVRLRKRWIFTSTAKSLLMAGSNIIVTLIWIAQHLGVSIRMQSLISMHSSLTKQTNCHSKRDLNVEHQIVSLILFSPGITHCVMNSSHNLHPRRCYGSSGNKITNFEYLLHAWIFIP